MRGDPRRCQKGFDVARAVQDALTDSVKANQSAHAKSFDGPFVDAKESSGFGLFEKIRGHLLSLIGEPQRH
jgi:hypothetical protein